MIYTEKEKEILIKYCLQSGEKTKANFENYLLEYVINNGQKKDKNDNSILNNIHYTNLNKWEYHSNDILWGNKENDNAFTFILSQLDEPMSSNKFRNLTKLNANWNHQNNNGETPLHILARKRFFDMIISVLSIGKGIDSNIKDKNGDYYSFIYFKPESLILSKPLEYMLGHREMTYLKNLNFLFNFHPYHFENTSLEKIIEIKKNYEIIKLKIEGYFKEHESIRKSEIPKEKEETYGAIERSLQYYELIKKIPNENKKSLKNKI